MKFAVLTRIELDPKFVEQPRMVEPVPVSKVQFSGFAP